MKFLLASMIMSAYALPQGQGGMVFRGQHIPPPSLPCYTMECCLEKYKHCHAAIDRHSDIIYVPWDWENPDINNDRR